MTNLICPLWVSSGFSDHDVTVHYEVTAHTSVGYCIYLWYHFHVPKTPERHLFEKVILHPPLNRGIDRKMWFGESHALDSLNLRINILIEQTEKTEPDPCHSELEIPLILRHCFNTI